MTESCIIIGLGQIGMDYDYYYPNQSKIFTHAQAIHRHPKFKLLAAVDISNKQRKRFESRYNLPAFDNIELALKKMKPDIVVIAVPTEQHASVLKKIISVFSPKIILCEKPLAYKLEEANNMIESCQNAGIELFVNYMRRVDKGVLEIKRRIDKEMIKAPIKTNVWYSKGLYNNGSHFLNLLDFWFGDIKSISVIDNGRLWKNFDPEPDFKVEYMKGSAVFRSGWEESFSHYNIEILSQTGRLVYDKGGEFIEWQASIDDPKSNEYKILDDKKNVIQNSMKTYQKEVYDYIYEHLIGKKTTLCTGNEALKTLIDIHMIIKKIKIND